MSSKGHPIFRLVALTVIVGLGFVSSVAAGAPTAVGASESLQKALAAETARVQLIERLSRTVCAIFPALPEDGKTPTGPQGGGSGVIIDAEGYALTNYHVAGEAEKLNVGLSDGRVYSAVVKGRDPTGDIAVIKIEGGPFPFASLGDSDFLQIGDWVLAMGNPFGLATDFVPTVTQGVVSGLHRYLPGTMGGDLIYTDCIQVDAPINPGNSGGPLFDLSGRLVGINGRVSVRPSRGKINSGVGFAIPINQIKEFLADLRAGLRVHHAVLGVELTEDAPDVTIKVVLPLSAADKAGLLAGDVVRRFQGHDIRSDTELINRIGILPAGKRARIVIEREGRQYDLEVALGGRPTGTETAMTAPETPAPTPEARPPVAPDVPADLSAQEVARRFVAALGGYEAFEEIKDTISTGRTRKLMLGTVWVDGRILQYDIGATRLRHETAFTYRGNTLRQITAFDGYTGWVYANGQVADITPQAAAAVRGELEAAEQLTKRDGWRGVDARNAGTEMLDGRKLIVIVTRDAQLNERRWSFDPATWYLVRYVRKDAGGGTIDDRIGDYRRVGKVLQPFHSTRYISGVETQTTQVESIEFNRGVKEDILRDKPAVRIGPKVY